MTAKIVISALVLGLLFGFALQKSGLGNYDKVVNQFRFKDNTMIKFMLTAVAVGAVGTFALRGFGVLDGSTTPDGYLIAALVGGGILGVGMAIAGTCPGTIFAGIGQGNIDYLVPGFLGMLTGAAVYGLTFESIGLPIRDVDDYATGPLNVADLLGINPWILVAVLAGGVFVFYLLSKRLARKHHAKTTVVSTLVITFVLVFVLALCGCAQKTADTSSTNVSSDSSAPAAASISPVSSAQAATSISPSASTSAAASAVSATSSDYMMSAKDVKDALDSGSATVIDVRNYSYYIAGYIPDAVNIPLKNLADGLRVSEVPTDGTVIIYAATDDDADEARQTLIDNGYDAGNLKVLEGGFKSWSDAGYTIGKPQTPGC